jgi:hypothetical protein
MAHAAASVAPPSEPEASIEEPLEPKEESEAASTVPLLEPELLEVPLLDIPPPETPLDEDAPPLAPLLDCADPLLAPEPPDSVELVPPASDCGALLAAQPQANAEERRRQAHPSPADFFIQLSRSKPRDRPAVTGKCRVRRAGRRRAWPHAVTLLMRIRRRGVR